MEFLFIVKVLGTTTELDPSKIDEIAFNEFACEGRLDYNLNEATVDEILGRDAYCGGEIPEQILEKIEEANAENTDLSYFWQSEEKAKDFSKFLNTSGIETESSSQKAEDWNKTWRDSFQTIEVSDTLRVVPSWEKVEDSVDNIYIYPGMGFGTGNHETTFLCLKIYENLIDKIPRQGECLDFGCGSGILGIGAIKKSQMRVDFVDIDADALDNCVMNLEHNEFSKYRADHGVVIRERMKTDQEYDLVFANILENVLILEKELLLSTVKSGGYLIVSGLLKNQEETIKGEYSSLEYMYTENKGDWIAMCFKK